MSNNNLSPSSVLYFPSIEFRSVEWLKIGLLMWDRVYRIVPPGYKPKDSYEIQVARESGLIQDIVPTENDLQGVAHNFERFLKNLNFFPAGLLDSSEVQEGLHIGKIDERFFPLLEELSTNFDSDGFLNLPKGVVRGYMLYLVKSIAGRKQLATASDLRDAWTIAPYFRENGNFFDEADSMSDLKPNGCLSALVFADLLPFSLAPVSMQEIVDFVSVRSDERRELRDRFNETARQISRADSPQEAKAIQQQLEGGYQKAKSEFRKSSGFLGECEKMSLLTVGIPTAASLYGAVANYPVGELLKISTSVFVSAIASYKNYKERTRQCAKESGYSYLIDIDERLVAGRGIPNYSCSFEEFMND